MKSNLSRPLFWSLLLLFNLAGARGETLTYPDLVHHLTDLEHLAVLPAPGEKTALASSYDRASQYDATNDKYVNWAANADGGGIVREEGDTVVLADLKGPGCIWRTWSATARQGHVKIFLDGSTTPVIDRPFADFFDTKSGPFPWPNLVYVAAGPPVSGTPGSNCFVPIPFAKSCKIVGDKIKNGDEKTGWGAYYHFNYTLFPEGTIVPSFTLPFSAADKAALDEADRTLGQCGEDPAGSRPGEKTESQPLMLAPGTTMNACNLQGPGAITALKVKVALPTELDEDKRNFLRQLTIRITWDGETKPAVWSPLGDFFATVGGAMNFASLPVGLQPDGTFYCYWYMPFGKSAKVELGNDGPEKVPLTFTVTHAPLDRPIADFGRFHAKWHRDSFQPTRKDRWPDWTILTTQGRGRFVGTMLHAFVPVTIWWGEGDEKFFVDGEKFPSTFGTGSEDYFGYAWGAQGLFIHPFHGQVLNESNDSHVDDFRWHISDSVPFQTGFEADIEKYFYNDPPNRPDPVALYAAEAYWYLAPGGTDPYEPLPLNQRVGYWQSWARYSEPDAIEGEWLTTVTPPEFQHNADIYATQSEAPDVFSGNRELRWGTDHGSDSKEHMELRIPVRKTGKYRLLARFGKGPQYGIFQLTFEGKQQAPIDLYAAKLTAGDPVDLGTFDLTAGDHLLAVLLTGKNPAIPANFLCFGLDYIKLVPVP